MPDISAMSLAAVVHQAAHASGYVMSGPVPGTDPTGGAGYRAGSPPVVPSAPPTASAQSGWQLVRQFVVQNPGDRAHAGAVPIWPPCTDPSVGSGSAPQQCIPVPAGTQTCPPGYEFNGDINRCMYTQPACPPGQVRQTATGPCGCPRCGCPPKRVPWGWLVVTGIGAALTSLQFYGKVKGGSL